MLKKRYFLILMLITYSFTKPIEKKTRIIKNAILKAISDNFDLDLKVLKNRQKFHLIEALFFDNKAVGERMKLVPKFKIQTSNLKEIINS